MAGEYSALHVVAEYGYKHLAQYLISVCQVDVNTAGGEIAWTPLQAACQYQKEEIVRLLLDDDNIDVNRKDCRDATAMTYAVDTGNLKIVSMLLGHSKIDATQVYSYHVASPIYVSAVTVGSGALLLLLLEYKMRYMGTGLLTDKILVTLTQRSCKSGFVESVRELIDFGHFDINDHSNIRVRFTPLQSACVEGQLNVVKFLIAQPNIDLRKSLYINQSLPGNYGLIFLASSQGRIDVLELLLDKTSLSKDFDKSEAVPFVLQFTEKALKAKYVEVGKALLSKIEQHLSNNDVVNKVIQCNAELTRLMTCAVNNNLKSIAHCIDRLYLTALSIYARTNNMDPIEYMQPAYAHYVSSCYTDYIVYGSQSLRTSKNSEDSEVGNSDRDLRILFQMVNLGLVKHVEMILKQNPQLSSLLALSLPEKKMSVLQCSMQHEALSKMLLDITQKEQTNIDPCQTKTFGDFKSWYGFLSKLSTGVKKHSGICDTSQYRRKEFNWVIDGLERWESHSEYQLVRSTISKFLHEFSRLFKDTIFEFKPVRVGSSSEGTRPFIPNEFDYLLLFTKLVKFFDCNRDTYAPGVLYQLKLKDKYYGNLILTDIVRNGCFSTQALNKKLQQLFTDAIVSLFTPTFGEYLTIETPFYESEGKMIHSLRLIWRGNSFKDMPISIDLVPAFYITDLQPFVTELAGKFADGPFYLFTKPNPLHGGEDTLLPVAFSIVENKLISSLPKEIKLGFKLAKGLRRSDLFSNAVMDKFTKQVHNIEDYLTTYMLKTALFFLAFSLGLTSNPAREIPQVHPLVWTKRIYERLLRFISNGHIPLFFESTFQDKYMIQASSIFSNVLRCEDPPKLSESQRRACCLKRQNLAVISEYMISMVRVYLYGDGTTAVSSLLEHI